MIDRLRSTAEAGPEQRHDAERLVPLTRGQPEEGWTQAALACPNTRSIKQAHGEQDDRARQRDRQSQVERARDGVDRHRRAGAAVGTPARAHHGVRLPARAAPDLGDRGAAGLHRRALLSGALEHHRRHGRHAHEWGIDRACADQPAAHPARLPPRRHSGDRDRHHHGHLAPGARAGRSPHHRHLPDPQERNPAVHSLDLRAWRDVEDRDGGDRRVLSDRDQRHRRRAADPADLSRRRQELQGGTRDTFRTIALPGALPL